ncbi:MAG: PEGA domain-containing protein [Planctomycetota bacterium]|nr:MAG: PEGA domain-containing protein [Planctomycetota bacterium]
MAALLPRRFSRKTLVLLVAAATIVPAAGCVQRRMTIRSNPPGALVYVDDYQIGTTPVSTDFTYYGTRKIRLVKDGYETLTVRQPFPIPWYEVFPLDFVAENLWPAEIRDERVVDLAMAPADSAPPESVIARAQQARVAAGSLPILPPSPAPRPSPSSSPPGPLQYPGAALQPPLQNAPAQGIPSLGAPAGF